MPEPATPLAERPWEDVARMLDVDTAMETILAAFAPLATEDVALLAAADRALLVDLVAAENVPPFRNAAMDGYAVRSVDVAAATWSAPVHLPVLGTIAAGARRVRELPPGHAIRIMTGAPLPLGADAVVRFEETDEASARKTASTTIGIFRPPATNDNVREAGEDLRRGQVIVRAGRRLRPPDLGLIASVGVSSVQVHRRPRVAILSTGNELSAPGDDLAAGSIRDSNSVVLGALARMWGAEVHVLGIARDSASDLSTRLRSAGDVDLIVTSGGVSVGDFDLVKDVLRTEGRVEIWQVRMKPGKPLAFGHLGSTPLLGLPGNPVAAAVSFLLFGRPAMRRMLGYGDHSHRLIDVVAGEAIENRGQRRHYVRVRLTHDANGDLLAHCVGEQGAGILSSLAAADALLVVPESYEAVVPGMRMQAINLDWIEPGR
jgi:molybdopterin molybdotransferase